MEILQIEESRTLEQLRGSVTRAGEDLCRLDEVRDLVRAHPAVAVGAAAAAGVLLAPLAERILRYALPLVWKQARRHGPERALGDLLRHV